MDIYWKWVMVIYSSNTQALLIKIPENKESTELTVYNIEVHNYEDIEDAARDQMDFKELWKRDVQNDDTEMSYDDWYDDNSSSETEYYIAENRDFMWYEVASYDCYRELRKWSNCNDIYYEAQCELKEEKTFNSFSELENYIYNYTDISDYDSRNDSELRLELAQYFYKDEYVAIL